MKEIKSKLRKWGNSFGIVIPQKIVEEVIEEKIETNSETDNIKKENEIVETLPFKKVTKLFQN